MLLATATASGKSLVYNLAVALRALEDPQARALFLFPLKALEQDQLAGLRADLATLPKGLGPSAHGWEVLDLEASRYRDGGPAPATAETEVLRRSVDSYWDAHRDRRQDLRGELEEEELERLRALGYIR